MVPEATKAGKRALRFLKTSGDALSVVSRGDGCSTVPGRWAGDSTDAPSRAPSGTGKRRPPGELALQTAQSRQG